jgi:hypothetical protein
MKPQLRRWAIQVSKEPDALRCAKGILVLTLAIFMVQIAFIETPFFNRLTPLYRYTHGISMIGVLLVFNLLVIVVIKSYLDEDSLVGTYKLAGRMLSVSCPVLIISASADCFVLANLVLRTFFYGMAALLIVLTLFGALCTHQGPPTNQ